MPAICICIYEAETPRLNWLRGCTLESPEVDTESLNFKKSDNKSRSAMKRLKRVPCRNQSHPVDCDEMEHALGSLSVYRLSISVAYYPSYHDLELP